MPTRTLFRVTCTIVLNAALAACMLSPAEEAERHGLPALPFTDMVLQVVDASRADHSSFYAQFYWTLMLSDPGWVDYLSTTIFVMPPDDSTGTQITDPALLENESGAYAAVFGVWESGKASTVGFGDYCISSFGLFDPGDSSPPEYDQTFTAKNPDGGASGTYYTAEATGKPKLADVSDFTLTMYQDGLGITLAGGTLSRADAMVMDFYEHSYSSDPIAELIFDADMLSALKSGTTIIVKPDSLADLYAELGVDAWSTGWYLVYCTVDSPEAAKATRTEYLYVSCSDETTNDVESAAPGGFEVFAVDGSARASPAAACGRPRFSAGADGIRSTIPRSLPRR
jgi:hypothetical protein